MNIGEPDSRLELETIAKTRSFKVDLSNEHWPTLLTTAIPTSLPKTQEESPSPSSQERSAARRSEIFRARKLPPYIFLDASPLEERMPSVPRDVCSNFRFPLSGMRGLIGHEQG